MAPAQGWHAQIEKCKRYWRSPFVCCCHFSICACHPCAGVMVIIQCYLYRSKFNGWSPKGIRFCLLCLQFMFVYVFYCVFDLLVYLVCWLWLYVSCVVFVSCWCVVRSAIMCVVSYVCMYASCITINIIIITSIVAIIDVVIIIGSLLLWRHHIISLCNCCVLCMYVLLLLLCLLLLCVYYYCYYHHHYYYCWLLPLALLSLLLISLSALSFCDAIMPSIIIYIYIYI